MKICVPEDMNIPWEGGPQEVRATADTVPPGARASNRGYRTTWGPPSESGEGGPQVVRATADTVVNVGSGTQVVRVTSNTEGAGPVTVRG